MSPDAQTIMNIVFIGGAIALIVAAGVLWMKYCPAEHKRGDKVLPPQKLPVTPSVNPPKFYKVLVGDEDMGVAKEDKRKRKWSLPKQQGDGTWQPGEWTEAGELDREGIRITEDPAFDWRHGATCFEVERDDQSEGGCWHPQRDTQHVRRCRLLRPLNPQELKSLNILVINGTYRVLEGTYAADVVETHDQCGFPNVEVIASGSAHVFFHGASKGKLSGEALGYAIEDWWGSVAAGEHAHFEGHHGTSWARISLDGHADGWIYGDFKVSVSGNSHLSVPAWENNRLRVRASGNAYVNYEGEGKVLASGNAVITAHSGRVSACGNALVEVDFGEDQNVTVKLTGNAEKRNVGGFVVDFKPTPVVLPPLPDNAAPEAAGV